jgi:hypothetical protein
MSVNAVTVTIELIDGSNSWDVTNNVIAISTSVGKNRLFDRVQPGDAQIVLTNFNREFDPLNTSSSFYGAVIPKASKVFIDYIQSGVPHQRFLFLGYIDDWSFDYSVSGEATATFTASEASALFARQRITSSSFPAEKSGDRINRILTDGGVLYSRIYDSAANVIDDGTQMLDADYICAGQNVLDYLNNVAVSEQGSFFYNTEGSLVFEDNTRSATSDVNNANRLFTDDGTANAYTYNAIDIGYTSELLYNQIQVSGFTSGTATYNDSLSQSIYNISHLDIENVLYNDSVRLGNLAYYLGNKYSRPEYRINSVTVSFKSLTQSQQDDLIAYGRINGFMKVKFKPNNIGTRIERIVKIIGIEHNIDLHDHQVKYSFESERLLSAIASLVLDDATFGKLDTYSLGL